MNYTITRKTNQSYMLFWILPKAYLDSRQFDRAIWEARLHLHRN